MWERSQRNADFLEAHETSSSPIKQLSSGSKFAGTSSGAADFSIGENIRAQQRGFQAAYNNTQAASNFVQVAEGGLNEQNNILIRLRELAVQAASDTYTDDERQMMNGEYQELTKEFDRIAQSTSYGPRKLLNGESKTYDIQVGPNGGAEDRITFESNTDTTASTMGVSSLSVDDKGAAEDALSSIDQAVTMMGQQRANLGAIDSRLSSAANYTSEQAVSLEEARSRIQDTDVAKSTGDLARSQAVHQYQLSVLAEANRIPGNALRLIA